MLAKYFANTGTGGEGAGLQRRCCLSHGVDHSLLGIAPSMCLLVCLLSVKVEANPPKNGILFLSCCGPVSSCSTCADSSGPRFCVCCPVGCFLGGGERAVRGLYCDQSLRASCSAQCTSERTDSCIAAQQVAVPAELEPRMWLLDAVLSWCLCFLCVGCSGCLALALL